MVANEASSTGDIRDCDCGYLAQAKLVTYHDSKLAQLPTQNVAPNENTYIGSQSPARPVPKDDSQISSVASPGLELAGNANVMERDQLGIGIA